MIYGCTSKTKNLKNLTAYVWSPRKKCNFQKKKYKKENNIINHGINIKIFKLFKKKKKNPQLKRKEKKPNIDHTQYIMLKLAPYNLIKNVKKRI